MSDPLKPRQIRLVRFIPPSRGDKARRDFLGKCHIERFELSDTPPYVALSYVRGYPNLAVDSVTTVNGQHIKVTSNLNDFLTWWTDQHSKSRERRRGLHGYIWIDRLCIDEKNVKERAQQSALVREIYAGAESVIAWLGRSPLPEPALNVRRGLLTPARLMRGIAGACVALAVGPRAAGGAAALLDGDVDDQRGPLKDRRLIDLAAYTNGYFTRLWTQQEMAFANDLVFVIGNRAISWVQFRRDHEELSRYVSPLRKLRSPLYQKEPLKSHLSYLVPTNMQRGPRSLSLMEAMKMLEDKKCTDPRDCVFGLLGLVDQDQQIPIDYTKTSLEVFTSAMVVLARNHELIRQEDSKQVENMVSRLAKKMGILYYKGLEIWLACLEQAQLGSTLGAITATNDMLALDRHTSQLAISGGCEERPENKPKIAKPLQGHEKMKAMADTDSRAQWRHDIKNSTFSHRDASLHGSRLPVPLCQTDTHQSTDEQQGIVIRSNSHESTPDASSSESEDLNVPFHTRSKAEVIDSLMEVFYVHLFAYFRQAQGEASEPSGSVQPGGSSAADASSAGANASWNATKRKCASPDDKDEEDEGGRKQVHSKRPKFPKKVKRFACPFFKHDPRLYADRSSCTGPGFPDTHRVKEHVYKVHSAPIHCVRCKMIFESENLLNQHHLAATRCDTVPAAPFDGINKAQEAQLKSRRKVDLGNGSEEVKWRRVYTIIFPDTPSCRIPSPYYSNSELEGFEAFVLREMPGRFQTDVENRYDAIVTDATQDLRTQIPAMIQDLLHVMIAEYRAEQVSGRTDDGGYQMGAAQGEAPTVPHHGYSNTNQHILTYPGNPGAASHDVRIGPSPRVNSHIEVLQDFSSMLPQQSVYAPAPGQDVRNLSFNFNGTIEVDTDGQLDSHIDFMGNVGGGASANMMDGQAAGPSSLPFLAQFGSEIGLSDHIQNPQDMVGAFDGSEWQVLPDVGVPESSDFLGDHGRTAASPLSDEDFWSQFRKSEARH